MFSNNIGGQYRGPRKIKSSQTKWGVWRGENVLSKHYNTKNTKSILKRFISNKATTNLEALNELDILPLEL